MDQDPFAQYAVAPAPKTEPKPDPFAAYAAPQSDPFAAYAVTKPEEDAAAPSMWERVKDFLTTPQAPEVVIPEGTSTLKALPGEIYNRFVRPVSSPVGAAMTGV